MFVDKAIITVKAGDGGNGCCSFHREKFVPRGGPDGGDGGAGGNVILEATNSEQSLVGLIYNRHYQAQNGPGGKGSNMHGHKAPDVILKVPVGTVVTDRATGEILCDMEQNRAKSANFCSNSRPSPTSGWWATPTRASRRCCVRYPRRGPRWRPTPSPHCIRWSAWWSTPIMRGSRWRTFRG